jgi:hypothetical protein
MPPSITLRDVAHVLLLAAALVTYGISLVSSAVTAQAAEVSRAERD